jgi:hypothetical protein
LARLRGQENIGERLRIPVFGYEVPGSQVVRQGRELEFVNAGIVPGKTWENMGKHSLTTDSRPTPLWLVKPITPIKTRPRRLIDAAHSNGLQHLLITHLIVAIAFGK